jgi:hypothetical protein
MHISRRFILIVFAISVVGCSGGSTGGGLEALKDKGLLSGGDATTKQPEALPGDAISLDPPTVSAQSLIDLMSRVEIGLSARDFNQVAVACDALTDDGLGTDLRPKLASYCFMIRFIEWLESDATATLQETFCGGLSTRYDLFGTEGYAARYEKSLTEGLAAPQIAEHFPCYDLLFADEPDSQTVFEAYENEYLHLFKTILLGLAKSGNSFEDIKPLFMDAASGLEDILPLLGQAIGNNVEVSLPKELMSVDGISRLQEGDLYFLMGSLKRFVLKLKLLAMFPYNLSASTIVRDLTVRDHNTGQDKWLFGKLIPDLLVLDAGSLAIPVSIGSQQIGREEAMPIERFEGELILNDGKAPILHIDDIPFGRWSEESNLEALKDTWIEAMDALVKAYTKPSDEVGALLSRADHALHEKIKESLENNRAVQIHDRVQVDFNRALESPPNIDRVEREDLAAFRVWGNPEQFVINFFFLGHKEKLMRSYRTCLSQEGQSELLQDVLSCKDAHAAWRCPEPSICEEREENELIPDIRINKSVLYAASKDFLTVNMEPFIDTQSARPRLCMGDENALIIPVSDYEGDTLRLMAAQPEAPIPGLFITPMSDPETGHYFRIGMMGHGAPGKYTVYLGASDGHGNPLGPSDEVEGANFDVTPDLIRTFSFTAEECDGEAGREEGVAEDGALAAADAPENTAPTLQLQEGNREFAPAEDLKLAPDVEQFTLIVRAEDPDNDPIAPAWEITVPEGLQVQESRPRCRGNSCTFRIQMFRPLDPDPAGYKIDIAVRDDPQDGKESALATTQFHLSFASEPGEVHFNEADEGDENGAIDAEAEEDDGAGNPLDRWRQKPIIRFGW